MIHGILFVLMKFLGFYQNTHLDRNAQNILFQFFTLLDLPTMLQLSLFIPLRGMSHICLSSQTGCIS